MKRFIIFLLALTLSAFVWAGHEGPAYRFSAVDYPGSANTALYAINDRGIFVGALKDQAGNHHAIVGRHPEHLVLLDPTGPIGTARESWAFSINNAGDITGSLIDAAGVRHGYIWRAHGGAVELLDYPGAAGTQGSGINDRGSVIGIFFDASGNVHAYTLRHGHYRLADLAGAVQTFPLSINNAEVIVGEYVKTPDTIGFGYVQRRDGDFELFSAPGSPPESTYFISINDHGQVLGGYFDETGTPRNFIREHGEYVPFDLPAGLGAVYVAAETINNRGDIVGYYFDANFVAHGFLAKAHR